MYNILKSNTVCESTILNETSNKTPMRLYNKFLI